MKVSRKNIKVEVKGNGKIQTDVNGQKLTKPIDRNKQRKDRIAKENKQKDQNQRIKSIEDRIDNMNKQFGKNANPQDSATFKQEKSKLDSQVAQLNNEISAIRSE